MFSHIFLEKSVRSDGAYCDHGEDTYRCKKNHLFLGNWEKMHGCLGVIVPIVILLVVVTIVYTSGKDDRFQKEKARLVATSVYASLLLLWPVVIEVLVGWNAVKEYKYLLIGFVWTSILLLYEMSVNMKEDESSKMDASIRSQSTRQFASITIGAAWAVGSLLAAIGSNGGFQKQGAKLLLLSLVLSISYIVPLSGDMDPRSAAGTILRSSQRSILHYSVGLFILGITMSMR